MHTKLAVSDNLLTSPVGKDLVGLEDYTIICLAKYLGLIHLDL